MKYFALRLFNTALGVLWGFGLTWVLVRAYGVDTYARFAFVAAIGLFFSASDFGVSRLLYALLREYRLTRGAGHETRRTGESERIGRIIVNTLWVFFGAWALATVLFALAQAVATAPPRGLGLTLSLFFAGATLNLPWMNLRALQEALGAHVHFETVDALRRLAQLALLSAMLGEASADLVFGGQLFIWVASFALVLPRLRREAGLSEMSPSWRGLRELGSFMRGKFGATVAFTLAELLIYNGAYFVLPLTYASPLALVFYDVFNKLFRAAIMANSVVSTALRPALTAFWHGGDMTRFRARFWVMTGVSVVGMLTFGLILLLVGAPLIDKLLDHQASPPAFFVTALILASLGNAIQNSAGTMIVSLGLLHEAYKLAGVMLGLMASLCVVARLVGLDFSLWLVNYAAIYATGSLLWFIVWARIWKRRIT